jgi:hypothetical protein
LVGEGAVEAAAAVAATDRGGTFLGKALVEAFEGTGGFTGFL